MEEYTKHYLYKAIHIVIKNSHIYANIRGGQHGTKNTFKKISSCA